MSDRPILFSGPMVRALLDGSKTQTRRVLKPQPYSNGFHFDGRDILCHNDWLPPAALLMDRGKGKNRYTVSDFEDGPEGMTGVYRADQLWVREAWQTSKGLDGLNATQIAAACAEAGWKRPWAPLVFNADGERRGSTSEWNGEQPGRKRSSRFMPRWASRLTLTVTDVRVQRLQDISEEDARAEGALVGYGEGANISERRAFNLIWEHINGVGSWDANPWVAAYTFTVERRNIDAALAKAGASHD